MFAGRGCGRSVEVKLATNPLTPLFALFQTFCCLLECSGKQACKALGVFAANWYERYTGEKDIFEQVFSNLRN
jgi:hypothetical protein